MKVTTSKGTVRQYKNPPVIVKRDVSFKINNPQRWSEEPFLDICWKRAGYWLTEVRLREVYRSPHGWMAHNYELYFQTGPGLLEPLGYVINSLVADIEEEAEELLDVDLRHSTHRRYSVEPVVGTHVREAWRVLKPVFKRLFKRKAKPAKDPYLHNPGRTYIHT